MSLASSPCERQESSLPSSFSEYLPSSEPWPTLSNSTCPRTMAAHCDRGRTHARVFRVSSSKIAQDRFRCIRSKETRPHTSLDSHPSSSLTVHRSSVSFTSPSLNPQGTIGATPQMCHFLGGRHPGDRLCVRGHLQISRGAFGREPRSVRVAGGVR